jgi:hypothetical protein
MKNTIKYVAPLAIAAAIGAGLGFAPVAAATTPVAHPPAPVVSHAPAPPRYESGTNPLVPTNTGALPFVLVPPGNGLAF